MPKDFWSLQCLYLVLFMTTQSTESMEVNTPTLVTLSNATSRKYQPVFISVPLYFNYGIIIPQLHSQYPNVVSSKTRTSIYGNEYNASNAGLVYHLPTKHIRMYIGVNSSIDVQGLFFAVPYVVNSPVPGACCLTCALDINANINITYDNFKTTIEIPRASTWFKEGYFPGCDNKEVPSTFTLQYDVYYQFLQEDDYTEKSLFDALWKMATPSSIKRTGNHLVTITGSDQLKITTEAVSRQGVIFNVIVSDDANGLSSAYVPVSTYACNFEKNECNTLGSTVMKVYCILGAIVGIVIAFGGLKLFRVTLFLSGMIFYWFIIFVLITRYGHTGWNTDDILIISACCSLVGGAVALFFFAFSSLVYVCVLQICITFGMFVAAIVFFTPFGYFSIWNVDYHFVLGYCCLVLFVTSVFLFYPKTLCLLHSSLLGSYAVILLPNYFIKANMQYIVISVVMRLVIKDYGSSYLRRPYQKRDYILTGIWAGLFFFGFLVQYFTTKKDEFIVSGSNVRQKVWKSFSESIRRSKHRNKSTPYYTPSNDGYASQSNEQTPLLSHNVPHADFLTFNNYSSTVQPSAPLAEEENLLPSDFHQRQVQLSSFEPKNPVVV